MGSSVVSHSTIDRLELVYDEAGRPLQLVFNGRIYNYVLNLQGDVQQIRRATDGVVVATYLYNAWGQLLQSTGVMAGENPLRYRGYFWCSAAEMYYLQSRYYDPVIGRFINADATWVLGVEQYNLLQFNLFAYALNNPVNFDDHCGYLARWIRNVAIGVAIAAVIVLCVAAVVVTGGGAAPVLAVAGASIKGGAATAATATAVATSAAYVGVTATAVAAGAQIHMAAASPGNNNTPQNQGSSSANNTSGSGQQPIAGRITGYTRHGINSAISHNGVGIRPAAILRTVRNPIRIIQQSGGRTVFTSQAGTVVLNQAGRIITTWARTSQAWRVVTR